MGCWFALAAEAQPCRGRWTPMQHWVPGNLYDSLGIVVCVFLHLKKAPGLISTSLPPEELVDVDRSKQNLGSGLKAMPSGKILGHSATFQS